MRVRWGVRVLVLATLAAGCQKPVPAEKPAAGDAVERGRYLTAIMACGDCHTPFVMGPNGPVPDETRYLSGHPQDLQLPPPPDSRGPWLWFGAATNTAFAGPWGVTYAANLTPDQNTGMGVWTEEMFVTALKQNKHMGTSRPIQPPMPVQSYSQATDADLRAIFAYLRTIPAISNRVPEWQPPAGADSASAQP